MAHLARATTSIEAAGPAPANLKPLTAVRFFAAAWVVLFLYWPSLTADSMPPLVAKGYLGVELFFTLSGFILCHVYLPKVEAGRFRYGQFLWARLSRIYPLHLVCILGIALLGAAAFAAGRSIDPNVLSLPALAPNLLLVHAWGFAPVSGWNHPSWSISAEWSAYLTFPAYAFVAMSLRRRPRLALALALAALFAINAAFQALAGFPLTEATFAWGALRIVPCFAYGCALYLVWRSGVVQGRSAAAAGALILGAAIVIGALFSLPDPVLVALEGGLILCLGVLSNQDSSAQTPRALVYLGEISYSIYMICVPWQLVFVNIVAATMHKDDKHLSIGLWIVFLAMVVPLAAISYHLIERPARAGMRHWAVGWGRRGVNGTSGEKRIFS